MLTILDYDEEIDSLIAKCKKIAMQFNHSQSAQTELQKIQKEQLNQKSFRSSARVEY